LVKEWGQLQEAFLARHHSTVRLDRRCCSGGICTRKLVSRAQWDHRNADRHGRTKKESESIRHARLMGQVINLCDQGPTMLAADRDVIAEPILANAGQSPASLALWLERTTNVVKLSAKEATATIARTHQRIHSFFRSKRHTVLPPGLTPESIAPNSAFAEGPPAMQAPWPSHTEHAHRHRAAALSAVAKGAVCPSQQSQMGDFMEAWMKQES
jgi:hypothetical protein